MSRFYAITYPIRFEDTMAYGSHHFLTNFRFQCAVRESLFFDYLEKHYPGARVESSEYVMLTRDGYSRNLAPAMLGERVAVLLSFAQATRSSMQLCVRTINGKGEPIACGFQTLVFMDRRGEFAPFPRGLDQFSGTNIELGERLVEPSFAVCALGGGQQALDAIFPAEIRALAQKVVAEGLDGVLVDTARPAVPAPTLKCDTVFSFPGQGSFDLGLFRDLCQEKAGQELLAIADPIVSSTLDASLRRLIESDDAAATKLLAASPDLDQFGMLLTEILLAQRLAQKVAPAALVGHSFGEIAALCVAGCFTPEVAVKIVAARVRALRQLGPKSSGMLAVSAPPSRIEPVLGELKVQSAINIAVVNDPNQSVLSGPRADLEALIPALAERRMGARMLTSRYPFHSPALASAARMFVMSLLDLKFEPTEVPVYSPILGRFYEPADALQIALSSHFTHSVDFPKALHTLASLGMTRIVECGAGGVLTQLVKRNTFEGKEVSAVSAVDFAKAAAPADPVLSIAVKAAEPPKAASIVPTKAAELVKATSPSPQLEPVAIVSMGCVVPGANDPEHLWRNLLDGTTGIVDLRKLDKTLEGDLIGGTQRAVQGDRSYSALAGYAGDVDWRKEFPFTESEFGSFSKAQRLLAEALRQVKAGADRKQGTKTLCLLGSTADGVGEYDDALLYAGARRSLDETNLDPEQRSAARKALDTLLPPSDPEERAPFGAYSAIVRRMFGEEVETVLLDAACASSLYALDLGLKALRAREVDFAYVGGVFAAGPSSSALFAQFGGLSATGSHALDKRADGVVFGEGAAVLGLRRLSDAVARGETIHAVVTASGLSSDGNSVSVNVPRADGQLKAIKAAYRTSGIDPRTIQYVEAHATATPVGDATEFKALTGFFGGHDPSLPRIKLGSIKSLVGHTGWLAGTTSIIKLVQSLKHHTFPPQHDWHSPGEGIDLAASPFEILTTQQPWPVREGQPRRAAVNGFGFGGTNAHVVIEGYDGPRSSVGSAPIDADIVCVGFGAAFAGEGPTFADRAERRSSKVNAAAFRLPGKKLLIPDALEQMDTGQFTVLASADRVLISAGMDLAKWKERTAVVIGSAGKARRGVAAIQGILADRLGRKLEAQLVADGRPKESAAEISAALAAQLKASSVKPSNAYTLVGMMPNLAAGRVVNVFDLTGPSLVVDTGPQSLLAALRIAGSYLSHRVCDVVLAGAVNATAPWPRAGLPAGDDGSEPDGATVLALMRRETAMAQGFKILATVSSAGGELTVAPSGAVGATETHIPSGRPHEVGGIAALAACMHGLRQGGPAQRFRWSGRAVRSVAGEAGYRHDLRPISFYQRIPVPVPVSSNPAGVGRILLITDQPKLSGKLKKIPGFENVKMRTIVPTHGDDERFIDQIAAEDVDLILIARDLGGIAATSLLDAESEATATLDCAFLAVRHLHPQIEQGRISVVALHLNGWQNDALHPEAAIIHGMLKSLAREWPSATIRGIATDSSNLKIGVAALERELGQPAPASDTEPAPDVEIIEKGRRRHALRFAPALFGGPSKSAPLTADSVVVLTGGARGVTAVMAEALIERCGCRLVLLGRSDPSIVPPALRSMSLEELERHETEYYRSERQRNPKCTIPELKREFTQLKAAHETHLTTEKLSRVGRVEFKVVDITVAAQVDSAIRDVVARHGAVDLVVHGAGLQISKRIGARQLGEFQQVVRTKLGGLRNLVASCARHAGPDVHFHILTSAFSAMGNDGQPDYGAANEALSALACTHAGAGDWTALGWLGWAAVGMTRGSEYAVLGNSRGLRPVLPEEGKQFFLDMIGSKIPSPALTLLSEGEVRFYRLPIARDVSPAAEVGRSSNTTVLEFPRPAMPVSTFRVGDLPVPPAPRTDHIVLDFPLSLNTAPYLRDHQVNGSPALPGTFEVEFALRAARALRPEHAHVAARNPKFQRFVRVPSAGTSLRAEARVVSETEDQCVVGVRLLSDFVHQSGAVLKRDVLHFEGEVLTSSKPFAMNARRVSVEPSAVSCTDPYLWPSSPVKLGGMFACLHDIRVGRDVREARYQIDPAIPLDSLSGFLSPVLLLDALFRLVGLAPDGDVRTGGVSVPLSGDTFHFAAGLTDLSLQGASFRMFAAAPRSEGEFLRTEWGHVIDAEGRPIVSIKGALARRMVMPASIASAS